MAKPKKGQLMQFMVPMVDATDFASVESAITESDFNSGATVKFFGVNHGVSTAFTSGTVSKTARLVRSGVFQITLKTTENNYDEMMVRINKTGCAEQIVTWETVDNDDSDLMSALTVIQSMASDAASAAAQANSRVLLNQSRISDVASYLVALSDELSDAHSNLNSVLAVVQSMASDAHSAATAGASRALINQSRISDVASYLVAMSDSLSDAHSDLASKIGAITASVSASDISDIASAVQIILSDTLSNILSAAVQGASRALINQSRISDVASYLVAMSDSLSDAHSDLASKIGAITASVSASDISDIASAVRAILISDLSDIHSAATAGASRALLNQSRISDVYSLLSDLQSDFQSRVPKETAARSQLSDLASDLRSYVVGNSATLSDIYSLLSDLHSDLGVMSGVVSDVYSNLAAGVTVGASSISDIASAAWARAGADPTTVPAVTATMGAKLDWITALARNKLLQTSALQSLRNDGDTDTVASATVSDDGTTYTRQKWSS